MLDAKFFAAAFLTMPALCYVAQAANYYIAQGRIGMLIAFSGYAVSNVGLLMDFYGI